jgi:hypothetical protein
MSTAWICPRCRRRVPSYVAVCYCGEKRPAEETTALPSSAAPRGLKGFTWDMWAAAAAIVLAVVLGVVWLARPSQPRRIVPVLGQIEPEPTRSNKR